MTKSVSIKIIELIPNEANCESSVDLASATARLQDTAFTSYSAFKQDKLSKNDSESLDKTIDICLKTLFKTPDTLVEGISKNDFCNLLNLGTKESFFTFNNKFYIQVDSVAMGSPLGPILANIFLSHHEENWLNKCPIKFKPSFYRRYVDNIFVLFEPSKSAESFREYMSSKHQNLNFTVEKENAGSLLVLDVKICRKNGEFLTSVYRKPTFSVAFTNYESFISTYQKRGLLHTLLHRSFSIGCDFKKFHFEIDHLNTILIKNNYTLNFIDSCIK